MGKFTLSCNIKFSSRFPPPWCKNASVTESPTASLEELSARLIDISLQMDQLAEILHSLQQVGCQDILNPHGLSRGFIFLLSIL